jgi:hypothetical protein
MMDCGNDGGRVPRPVLPKVRNQTGGDNSLLRKDKYAKVGNYQSVDR